MLAYQIMILRKRAGLSQLQLAVKLNVCSSAVGMYEQGRREPSVDLLIDMANLFGVSLDYLITGKNATCSIAGEQGGAMQPCCSCQTCCHYKPKLPCNNCQADDDPGCGRKGGTE